MSTVCAMLIAIMKLILPCFQANLTAADFEFVASVIAPNGSNTRALESLLCDNDTTHTILDNELLFRAIIDHPEQLNISPHLFFYILINQSLKEVGITDGEITDYLASLLSEKVQSNQAPSMSPRNALFYAVDLMERMQAATHSERFFIMAQIANQSLFVTGIFPNHVRQRAQSRAAPDITYYASIGRSNYKAACDHRLAAEFQLENIFGILGEQFEEARQALNYVGDNLVFLHDHDNHALDKFLN